MNKEMKMDFLEALRNARRALESSRAEIDELNGFLEELGHYSHLDEEDVSEDTLELLEELQDTYMSLPVWDTIDNWIDRLEDAEDELKNEEE
jgi:hypothetical protein